jgi:hypothetical protein
MLALASACDTGGATGSDLDASTQSASCGCELTWEVDSVVPCIAPPALSNPSLIYSTRPDVKGDGDDNGDALPDCDPYVGFPQPVPEQAWSAQRLRSTCGGSARLCVALKHGSSDAPTDDDCVVTEHCFDVDYQTPGEIMELEPLPGWSADDAECSNAYYNDGGYVEFRAAGEIGCDGRPQVRRVQMCPNYCQPDSEQPECQQCATSRLASDF